MLAEHPAHLPQVTVPTAGMAQCLINQYPSFCVSQIGTLKEGNISFCSGLSHSIPAVGDVLQERLAYMVGVDDFFVSRRLIWYEMYMNTFNVMLPGRGDFLNY